MKSKIIYGLAKKISALLSMLILLLAIAASPAMADGGPDAAWSKTFGGSKDDRAYSVQQTSDGGYILVGSTFYSSTNYYDDLLIKVDSNGNQQWVKTFGGSYNDYINSVQQASDGGYILAGCIISSDATYSRALLIKTDANGNQQWTKTFSRGSKNYIRFVQQTSDEGYILAGSVDSSSGVGNDDFWLIKTDANGNQQWTKTFGGSSYDYASSVQQTSDGGYILVGYTASFGAGGYDAWLIKTDANGDQQWTKTFGGSSSDYVNSIQQTSDGGYILAGYTNSFGAGYDDAWLIKTDASGNQQWAKTFGGSISDQAYSVQQTSDGGYILAGHTVSFASNGNGDAWLIKTDANGNQQWNKTFGGSGYDYANSVQQTSDGGYILAGVTYSSSSRDDVLLIKVNPDSATVPVLKSISVSPSNITLTAGENQQLTVTATNSDNSTKDVTNSSTYESSDTSITTVSDTGLVTAVAPGTANITVSYQDQTVTVPVTVTAPAPTLEKITASPNPVSVTVGQSQQATVTAVYSDGSTKDVTGETAYQIQDTTTASVNKGLVTGLKAGDTSMTITYNGQSVTVSIMVTAPTVTKITVTPNALNLAVNESQQLSVTATYSDGSSKNVTNQASYQSGDANVVSVNSAGLAMGINPGSTNITVTFEGQSATVPVTVNAGSAELVNLTVNPISMYIAKSQTQQLSVTALYSDGTSKNVTTEASYQSGNTNVAEVSSSGLVTAIDFGSSQITVTYEGKSVVIPVTTGQYTVLQPANSGIQVSPPTVSAPATPPARKPTIPVVTSLRDTISRSVSSPTVDYPQARKYISNGFTVTYPSPRTQNKAIPVIYPKQ